MQVETTYKLEIPSQPKEIAAVENFVEDICKSFKVGDDTFGNILISVTEAANNAITHGNKSNPKLNVIVECMVDDSNHRLIFTVKDQGSGFDYNSLPDPTAPENIDLPCGRGVFLIKQLADLSVFSGNGSTIEMHFKI